MLFFSISEPICNFSFLPIQSSHWYSKSPKIILAIFLINYIKILQTVNVICKLPEGS